jgi:hypothetical protein
MIFYAKFFYQFINEFSPPCCVFEESNNIEFGYFLHQNYHLFDTYYCSKDSSDLPAQVFTKYDWRKEGVNQLICNISLFTVFLHVCMHRGRNNSNCMLGSNKLNKKTKTEFIIILGTIIEITRIKLSYSGRSGLKRTINNQRTVWFIINVGKDHFGVNFTQILFLILY